MVARARGGTGPGFAQQHRREAGGKKRRVTHVLATALFERLTIPLFMI